MPHSCSCRGTQCTLHPQLGFHTFLRCMVWEYAVCSAIVHFICPRSARFFAAENLKENIKKRCMYMSVCRALEKAEICFLARALRINFPVKPFNPALIRITVCIQTGCACMVCTSNPSLMTGLSCPDIGSYTRTFLDLFFEIFGCARQYEQALFLDIFGCALHSPNKFDSALACTKIALACTKIRLRSA